MDKLRKQDIDKLIEYTEYSKMPFGKYVGELLIDLPRDYLVWLVDESNIDKTHPSLYDFILELLED